MLRTLKRTSGGTWSAIWRGARARGSKGGAGPMMMGVTARRESASAGDWKNWGSTSGGGARPGAGLWFVRFLRYQVGLKLI